MQLLLATTRKATVPGWTCHSCRRGIITRVLANGPVENLRSIGPARTRFAPSPTGYLHLGSLRTALFNYLVAKATGGQFLLRVEDTDQKRTVKDAEARLYKDLEWAGIEWDEGPKIGGPYGPYKQSERLSLYREHTDLLLESGKAYRCFCTPARLKQLGSFKSHMGLSSDYDRRCTHIPKYESDDRAAMGEAHTVRLMVPDRYPAFNDLVYGRVNQRELTTKEQLQAHTLGSYADPILMKSDGFPTYHLANVVDDHHMKITHVIRGSEWISSTPKHLAMYEAFGWQPPLYAHVGLLLDDDRNKLSKRHGASAIDIDVSYFRRRGIFPEALTNFVALLGWSHSHKKDVMSMAELINQASMKYTRGDSVVSFEKLWYLQRKHAARYASLPPRYPLNPLHSLRELAVKPMVLMIDKRAPSEKWRRYESIPAGEARENYVASILKIDAENYTTPGEFITRNLFFFSRPAIRRLASKVPVLKLRNVPPHIRRPASLETLVVFKNISAEVETGWTVEKLKAVTSFIVKRGVASSMATAGPAEKTDKPNQILEQLLQKAWSRIVHRYLRWALFAGQPGPDGAESMMILGKEETIKRLAKAEAVLKRFQEIEKRKRRAAEDGIEDVVTLDAGARIGDQKELAHDSSSLGEWMEQEFDEDNWRDLLDEDFI